MLQFLKDRDEAFASMDEDRIKEYCKKYKITIPEDDTVFWGGVHKVVRKLYFNTNSPITTEQYEKSTQWLIEHGCDLSIWGGEK